MPSTCAFASFFPTSPSPFRTNRTSYIRCCRETAPPSDESVLLAASRAYIDRSGVRPSAAAVSSALRSLAVNKRSNSETSELPPSSVLTGRWRLIFSASKRTGLFRDLYFPVHVCASWQDNRFINTVFLSPLLQFQLSGPSRWVDKHSRLEFTFCDALLKLGSLEWSFKDLDKDGSTLEGRTVKTLPFFTFVFVNQHLAAARGSSGGLAVWYREEE